MKPARPMIAFYKTLQQLHTKPSTSSTCGPAWSARHPRRAPTRLQGPTFAATFGAHCGAQRFAGPDKQRASGSRLRTACVDLTAITPAPGLRACSHHG
jgi:hypothetical protein